LFAILVFPYMVGKLEMSSFQPNMNHIEIPLVAPDMSQTVNKGLVWQICLVILTI